MKPKLLIVDDQEPIRKLLRDMFSDEFDCFEAGGVTDALLKFEALDPHVTITDLAMGSANSGLLLIQGIRKINPDAGIILISGTLTKEVMEDAILEGAFAVVEKPFSNSDLYNVVSDCLQQFAKMA